MHRNALTKGGTQERNTAHLKFNRLKRAPERASASAASSATARARHRARRGGERRGEGRGSAGAEARRDETRRSRLRGRLPASRRARQRMEVRARGPARGQRQWAHGRGPIPTGRARGDDDGTLSGGSPFCKTRTPVSRRCHPGVMRVSCGYRTSIT